MELYSVADLKMLFFLVWLCFVWEVGFVRSILNLLYSQLMVCIQDFANNIID